LPGTTAKAAIDCALHDLNASASAAQLLGEKFRDSVPILRILATRRRKMAAGAKSGGPLPLFEDQGAW
jgi:L-alanine-DL-glutamate epimerase-like enolase superfamily enzyme